MQDVNQYTKTRYNIISLTLQKIIKANPEFYDLILLIALLDSQDIPEELLSLYKNQYVASSFLRNLKKNSLITNIQYQNNNKKDMNNLTTFSIHRSTQNNILADIINSLSFIQRQEHVSSILTDIQSYILKQIDLENSTGLKNLIRHCDALLSKQSLLDKDDLTSINNDLGIIYYYLGQDKQAKDILEESVDIYKQIRPEDHPDIGRNILNLGIIYGEIQENTKAKELLEKSLRDYERNYGKGHIETDKVLNHLGRFYILSKNFKSAEEILIRASNILEQNSHPEVYRSFELLGDLHSISNKELSLTNYNKSLKLALKYFSEDSMNVNRIRGKIER